MAAIKEASGEGYPGSHGDILEPVMYLKILAHPVFVNLNFHMPMIVDLGVALDVLVSMLVLGVFFFQIREQFDSLDLSHLESLKEDQ